MNAILIWGAGSQAAIYHNLIKVLYPNNPITIYDPTGIANHKHFKGTEIFCEWGDIENSLETITNFVVAIGNNHGALREKIGHFLEKTHSLTPLTLIHPEAFLGPKVEIGKGTVVLTRAVITDYSKIGNYCIVNTNATIDHEAEILDGTHIMGGASIAGRVKIGKYSSVGTNATILPDLKISDHVFIGAGCVVTKNCKANTIYTGIPSRPLKEYRQVDRDIF